jgi:hypothetical protein
MIGLGQSIIDQVRIVMNRLKLKVNNCIIVCGFTRSRKCKEIDVSIDVIVPLYFIYSQQNTEGTR